MIEFKNYLFEVELWLGAGELPWSDEQILTALKKQEKEFLVDFAVGGGAFMSPEQEMEIEHWQWSVMGQEICRRLVGEILIVFEKMQKTHLGSHDLRHMILSTWETAIEIDELNQSDKWQVWAIVGEIVHDLGHVIEVKLEQAYVAEGKKVKWGNELHGQLSFFILQKLFTGFPDIPEKMRQLVLYAVLFHSGTAQENDMPGEITALVQSGDRSQLMSCEAFYRLAQAEVNERNYALVMRRNEEEKFKLKRGRLREKPNFPVALEFFWRNVYLRGEKLQARDIELKKDLGRILYQLVTDEEKEQIFYPELTIYERKIMGKNDYVYENKNIVNQEMWDYIKTPLFEEEKDILESENEKSIMVLVDDFWSPAGSANMDGGKEIFKKRVAEELEGENLNNFKKALILYLRLRRIEKEKRVLKRKEWQERGLLKNVFYQLVIDLEQRYL